MNLVQLKYVLTLAESSSMREGAEKLFMSQPALSSSISELEKEIDTKIFERSNRGIRLTQEGREFLSYAKKVISQYDLLENRYSRKGKEKERFSVSTQHYTFAIESFARVVEEFAPEKYDFVIHETKTIEVLEHVRDHKSEVGIISYSKGNKEIMERLFKNYELEFYPLMQGDSCVYFWKDHPMADRELISLEELKDYPCIAFDQENDSLYYLEEEPMADHEFDKQIRSDDRATSMELLARLNAYSIGCGMLAKEEAILKGLVSVKLKEEDSLLIGYVVRKDCSLSEYGKAYIEELEKYKE